MHSEVLGVGTFKLNFKIGYVLDLKETFYIPSFSKYFVFPGWQWSEHSHRVGSLAS